LDPVLECLGKDHPGPFGPLALMTILRMFDTFPIRATFERYGFEFGVVPGVRLPQRRFADADEADEVVSILRSRGIDTSDWEDTGKLYADLFVAARADAFPPLLERMGRTQSQLESGHGGLSYIRR
ncbi:MAG: hypothetical protein MJB57_00325, partial [Gemmatimonadetes bacterium]|nr:hypothetical protein [Gemmatimonadota bacterium]